MSAEYINDTAGLEQVCRALAGSAWLTVDTEFMRERTYRAQLCLVQVASHDIVACIDPLATGSLAPLFAVLHNARTQKVLHAARQDLEVFYDLEPRVPQPVFDTQIAAAYLGHDDQIGYGALVQALTGRTLGKTQTRTDWSRRPLTPAQLEYAADDVDALREVYERLMQQLIARGRLEWVEADCRRLLRPELYAMDPEQAWRRLRGGSDLPPQTQPLLRSLAVWRERVAQERNRPRGWILRDETLFEIARHPPQTREQLSAVAGLDESALRRHGEELLDIVQASRRAEPMVVWERQPPLDREQSAHLRSLMARVRDLAQQHQLAPAVLATRRDMERVVRGADPAELWTDWRGELLRPVVSATPG